MKSCKLLMKYGTRRTVSQIRTWQMMQYLENIMPLLIQHDTIPYCKLLFMSEVVDSIVNDFIVRKS